MHFTIPEEYLHDVHVKTVHSILEDRDNPTNDDLIKILSGQAECVTYSVKEHDEFTALRNQLEELGYIKCQRSCWNGDRVLKPFTLNGWKFKKGNKFPCAAAIKSSIECARKFGWKNISHL